LVCISLKRLPLYVSGDTEKQLSVSDANWKRLGQIAVSKIQLIRRSNGLIVSH